VTVTFDDNVLPPTYQIDIGWVEANLADPNQTYTILIPVTPSPVSAL